MADRRSKADYPGAFIPFDKQAGQKPASAIDDPPLVQMCINEDWLPYVITCLKTLGRPETWDDTYDNAVIAASEFAQLVGNLQDYCGTNVPSKLCLSGSFEDDHYGWKPGAGAQCSAAWIAGVGWKQCCDATPQAFLQIERDFGLVTVINGFALTINLTAPYLIDYDVTLYYNGVFTSIASDTGVTGPTIEIDVSGLNEPADSIQIEIRETFGGCAADVVLTNWKLCYTGAFPLSELPSTNWSHTFNFLTSNGGWTSLDSHTTWVSGVGWKGVWQTGVGADLYMHHPITPTQILTFSITYTQTLVGGVNRLDNLHLKLSGTDQKFFSHVSTTVTNWVDSYGVGALLDDLVVDYNGGTGNTGAVTTITEITVTGVGFDPF